jgi:hypothetical protein
MPLRNDDMTDRELLIAIKHATGREGWVRADELAYDLGFVEDGKGVARKVTTRCGYMVRQGWLNRANGSPVSYQISEDGHALINGRLNNTVARSLNAARVGDQILIVRELAGRAFSDPMIGTAVRREFEHQRASHR